MPHLLQLAAPFFNYSELNTFSPVGGNHSSYQGQPGNYNFQGRHHAYSGNITSIHEYYSYKGYIVF